MDDMWDDDTWEENDHVPPVTKMYSGPDRCGFHQRHNNNFERQDNSGYGRNFGSRDGGRDNRRDGGRDNRGFNDNRRFDNNRAPQQERYTDVDQNAEEFYIKSTYVSMIIGRGGETIRGLQDKFRTRISIDKNTTELGMALVKITGRSPNDIKACSEHIKQLCQNEEDKLQREKEEEEPELQVPRTEDGSIDYEALNRRCDEARRERWAKCPQLIKNFYHELPEVANMSPEEVQKFRTENMNISVARTFKDQPGGDDPIPNPVINFEQAFGDYPDMMEEIRKAGFTRPSPIQSQSWPVLLKGEDLIGIAQTGTGKTLAFLLPAMIHIDQQPIGRDERGGPNVLVMAPTRELALQIEKEVEKYQFRGIKACCLYGGGARDSQIKLVKNGVQIIIATPGRLNDLVAAKCLKIESITYLVLDEADRMLDMGFEPQIRKLLLDIRPDRQTVMTSATWPPGVRRLASSYMQNPIQVFVGSLDLAATHTVTQHIEIIEEDEKYNCVLDFIKTMTPTDKAIIFCGKKARADDLASDLALNNIANQSIHGNREQSDREQALADIKDGTVRILVATDVASRGLDIEDITHVVNMDFPRNIEEYVHRVGRTGRAGRSGISLSFLTRNDWAVAAELINILAEANQTVPAELQDMADRFKAKKEKQEEEKRAFGIGGGHGGRGRDGGNFGGRGRDGDNFGGRGRDFGGRDGGNFGGRGRDNGFSRDSNGFGGSSFDTISSTYVDQGKVGAVIGRQGSTIRDTQTKFNVKIDVDKNQGSRAKVTVKGQSEADVSAAIAFIDDLVGRHN